ncbi:MAG: hypothetical protein DCC55_28890 [Chloroflexi bacterium]|nr:MAG: hypothetical protein DCC55_28890 [Chloroflexota bacterium]
MQELLELRALIEQGRYPEALVLLGELDEMSHEDKVNKIGSFLTILLLHLIKQHAEQRSTRSWEVSIRNALREISATNKRRKAGGYHLTVEELQEAIDERYAVALDLASIEAFEGRYDPPELAEMVDEVQVKEQALEMILEAQ